MRRLALVIEVVAIAILFASVFAGAARYPLMGGATALLAGAAFLGWRSPRRTMPGFWLWYLSLLVYAFLYLPLAIVVVFSFNNSKLNAEWVGFTLDWYHRLLGNADMLQAAGNSVLIALTAAAMATILGTMAGIAIHRYKSRVLPGMVFTPVAMPEILLGVSLLVFFLNTAKPALASVGVEFDLGLATVIIAHITFCIGFVAIIVRARLAGMDESIFEAARDLGASPWQTFRLVTLPLILPGVIAGALMAFTLSIDDFVITFFTSGLGTKTLPLEIYTMIKTAVTPEVNAVSTLLMLLTLAMIVIAGRVAPEVLRGKE